MDQKSSRSGPGNLVRGACELGFSRHLDHPEAIQARRLGCISCGLGSEQDGAVYEFAETATRRALSRYSRVATWDATVDT